MINLFLDELPEDSARAPPRPAPTPWRSAAPGSPGPGPYLVLSHPRQKPRAMPSPLRVQNHALPNHCKAAATLIRTPSCEPGRCLTRQQGESEWQGLERSKSICLLGVGEGRSGFKDLREEGMNPASIWLYQFFHSGPVVSRPFCRGCFPRGRVLFSYHEGVHL